MGTYLIDNVKIAIVGGGPVGLTTAMLLQKKGANVHVYERDTHPQSRITGGTLDIHKDSGQLALEKAGILKDYYQNARPTQKRTTDLYGNILREEIPTEDNKYEEPEIDRHELRTILLNRLHKDTVNWDSQITDVIKETGSYTLQFKNGTTTVADFVIVANGGMSNVRSLVTDSVPEYTGSFVIQGEVAQPDKDCPHFKNLSNGGNLVVFGGDKILSSQTKRSGAIVFYVAFKAGENWLKESGIDLHEKSVVANYLIQLFQLGDERYKELFRAGNEFTALAMKKMPLEKPWKAHNNITLVGDAAHLMPPFAGQGVNIGLLDALYLTENITSGNFPDLQSAILDYEQKMFDYASTAQYITSVLEVKCYSKNALQEIENFMKSMFS